MATSMVRGKHVSSQLKMVVWSAELQVKKKIELDRDERLEALRGRRDDRRFRPRQWRVGRTMLCISVFTICAILLH